MISSVFGSFEFLENSIVFSSVSMFGIVDKQSVFFCRCAALIESMEGSTVTEGDILYFERDKVIIVKLAINNVRILPKIFIII